PETLGLPPLQRPPVHGARLLAATVVAYRALAHAQQPGRLTAGYPFLIQRLDGHTRLLTELGPGAILQGLHTRPVYRSSCSGGRCVNLDVVVSSEDGVVRHQPTHRESLRDIEVCLRAQQSKLYHMGIR